MSHVDLKVFAQTSRAMALSELAQTRLGSARLSAAGWQIDLSRHYVSSEAEAALYTQAGAAALDQAIVNLFAGEIVNPSEGRAALHWALRAPSPALEDAKTVRDSVLGALNTARRIRADGKIRAVVHIGIGGSDFGPRLFADAFADFQDPNITLRFCANLDPLDLELALDGLNPQETLVIGISKSFGTEETLYNLSRARDWLKASLGDAWAQHIALVTANPERAGTWLEGGEATLLYMPESVGGRFSIWSAGSFACMIGLGSDQFEAFLAGAAEMDAHVQSAPVASNVAIRLALLDYWNTSCLGFQARAVLAYSRRLRMLPTYLQQLEMESNGKAVSPDGAAVPTSTTPLLWGGEGTIGQHSYHQWLHQGTQTVPTEFILAPGSLEDAAGVTGLTAHALAQAEVLANGRTLEDVKAQEPNLSPEIAAQKVHPGGRPSSFFYTPKLTPHALGALIALYEHRAYIAGVLWGLNSFDQWGVERGKTMAGQLKPALMGSGVAEDPVTASLIGLMGR